MKKLLSGIIVSVFFAGCSVVGIRTTEEPDYKILLEESDFEIREYGEVLVAETYAEGDYDQATKQGFRALAGYIFGDNVDEASIEMTAPVMMKPESKKIEMTAPVMMEKEKDTWKMQFVMPEEFSMENIPTPQNKNVKHKILPPTKYAVIRFSGLLSEEKINEKTEKLMNWVQEKEFNALSEPLTAGYDPPWTIPFLRRNEVMVKISVEHGQNILGKN